MGLSLKSNSNGKGKGDNMKIKTVLVSAVLALCLQQKAQASDTTVQVSDVSCGSFMEMVYHIHQWRNDAAPIKKIQLQAWAIKKLSDKAPEEMYTVLDIIDSVYELDKIENYEKQDSVEYSVQWYRNCMSSKND